MAQRKSKYQPIPKAQQPDQEQQFAAPQPYADEICQWLAVGNTLREYCRQDGKPHWTTVYDWTEKDSDFALRIARARDLGYDAIAEEALAIANTPVEGVRTKISDDGVEETREDMLGHRKLQIETRLKLLAKWNPKKYGEKVQQQHTGADGGPIQTSMTYFPPEPKTADEWAKQYGEMMGTQALPGPDATDEEGEK